MFSSSPGRRERKKAATRDAIANAALKLFLEKGFDGVSIKDIADLADVSTTTVFKHFPSKEALLFDQDADQEAQLLSAVQNRPAGQSALQALCGFFVAHTQAIHQDPRMEDFIQLVTRTPALMEYGRRMWTRHGAALARVLALDAGRPAGDFTAAALAHFVLEIPHLVRGHPDPATAFKDAFEVLEKGWGSMHAAPA
ncbi:TetR/AcrR family transcriptional regulator [Deinococcus cellulosilyticus]|uniref:TetR family transcriptional regulator n=1 Tax=Deinococcus cellulosilyticus (strain DSM 18568 / NBRC 106333 / KACC 11606 / 5516J-15) TaxID=1223518 RepID=A0A511MZ59_DEIC1|nr:TetR/AcrR family transcriptional regulator [Deinococcus cellulosilyticus]GEM45611.1 TetR family transcriptional regulator [Deinococcus cellulosilyticus NBRC 106333 = KACC 11606]